MRRVVSGLLAILLVCLVLGTAYAAADIFDVVPGILTRDRAALAAAAKGPRPDGSPLAALPLADASSSPLAPVAAGAAPSAAKVLSRVGSTLSAPGLGPSVGARITDAATGTTLLDRSADLPRTPASTAKLLTAAAVSSTLDPHTRMETKVVQGATPSQITLVAGGDTMLAPGKGRPGAVEGRAGLADLATQVAAALKTTRSGSVTLRLDTSYAAGPAYAPGWNMTDVTAGFTQGVFMVGLAGQRPVPGKPSPTDPESVVLHAFSNALTAKGVIVKLAAQPISATPEPEGAAVLGTVESAPIGDVLSLALDESDNALTENLSRQAAVDAGRPATFAAAAAFVHETVAGLGIDLTGTTLTDSCGLSAGQKLPVRVLSDVLALGAKDTVPGLREVLSQLPIAGLDGTLHDRFLTGPSHAAAGLARAKTGTLNGVSALAGTVVDNDGRLLTYTVIADHVSPGVGTLNARAALDRFVAALASCGC